MKNLRLWISPAFTLMGLLAMGLGTGPGQAARSTPVDLNLAGEWRFRLDPQDVGVAEGWFRQPLTLSIQLPGSLQAQGYGNDPGVDTPWTGGINNRAWFTEPQYEAYRQLGNIKLPFWLTPLKHYIGTAWYQLDVLITKEWQHKHIELSLERCHWETTLWVDDRRIGSANSLSTPHVYHLSQELTPGRHRLTLRVDNRVKIGVGINAHSVSDHTQGNWNGIVGDLELSVRDQVYFHDIQVFPNVQQKTALVRLEIGNDSRREVTVDFGLEATGISGRDRHVAPAFAGRTTAPPGITTVEFNYALGNQTFLWDEFSPGLYTLDATLNAKASMWEYQDARSVRFGLREPGTDKTQITLNGKPIYLRGTLECSIFPLTGYPPTDVDAWKRIIRICKAHGLNHIRFHSWCPPEAAFVAADELGFYYQVECAAWANQGSTIGDGDPIDGWLENEGDRILRAYGNHPSFLLMAYGNEPAGEHQKEFLGRLISSWKQRDDRRLYTGAAGWPFIPENDFHLSPEPRIYRWGEGLNARINAQSPETLTDYHSYVTNNQVPVISHEIGQWCVYPSFSEIKKYSGVYQARNFEIFRNSLRANGMLNQAEDFLMASGKLQALCYKEEIEAALRTPGFGGFQLLDLHDFPGQGTALVGVLDPFWDSKGYISAKEYSRFCNSTVPLARMRKRVWTANETFLADIEVSHFGPSHLSPATVYWKLIDAEENVVGEGAFGPRPVHAGQVTSIGRITVPLHEARRAHQLKFIVGLKGTEFENTWDVWVFLPHVAMATGEVLITETLDRRALAQLENGGKVLLMPPVQQVAGDVKLGFSPIFWNTAWTGGQPPHTLGILCDPAHSALTSFPTEFHSNWQWWSLIRHSAALVLDRLPQDIRPVVQVIDDWVTNRRLGLVLEAKVAGGRLLVCSMDLRTDITDRPVAMQMLSSLLQYMNGPKFRPRAALSPDQVRTLLK